jgi:hypothetical protein
MPKKPTAKPKPASYSPSNRSMTLGPKKGALRGTERKRRMDAALGELTGDSGYAPAAKPKPKKKR